MRKIMKNLMAICLTLLMISPLFFVGCSKNYTVNIEVVDFSSNKGGVYLAQSESQSVVGENTIKAKESFEYFIVPNSGYEIAEIVIDGAVYNENYDRVGGTYLSFQNVKKDHKVKVTFRGVTREVVLLCSGGEGQPDEVFDVVQIENGKILNLNANIYGGSANKIWYKKTSSGKIYFYNNLSDSSQEVEVGYVSNQVKVKADLVIYSDLTKAQIQEIINALV